MLEIPDIKSCCPMFVFFGPLAVVGFFFLIFYLWVKDFVTILFQLHFGASSIHNGAISSAICITKSWSPSCLQLENQHILMTWYTRITIIIPRNILCLWEYLVMQVILFSDCEICLVYGVELFVVDLKINGRWRNGKSTLFALYFEGKKLFSDIRTVIKYPSRNSS